MGIDQILGSDTSMRDWFNGLRGAPRAAAAEAVDGAIATARAQLPMLSVDLRNQVSAAIASIHGQLSGILDIESAHAIRILAQLQPQLRAQLSDIAEGVGGGLAKGAGHEGGSQGLSLMAQAKPWLVAGGVIAAIIVVGLSVQAAILSGEAAAGRAERTGGRRRV